jgi:hypothetical protein
MTQGEVFHPQGGSRLEGRRHGKPATNEVL